MYHYDSIGICEGKLRYGFKKYGMTGKNICVVTSFLFFSNSLNSKFSLIFFFFAACMRSLGVQIPVINHLT
jgi:hypothetical protein